MSWQPPPPPPRPGQGPGPGQAVAPAKAQNYYQILHVDIGAHPTIIRYAYRFLAAMYHPDNSETGDSEKFRIITEAWRTLSDEGKRAAYDMSLGAEEEVGGGRPAGAPRPAGAGFKREGLPKITKTGISWNEVE